MLDWLFDLDWRRIWGWTWRIGLIVAFGALAGVWFYHAIPWGKPMAELTVTEASCVAVMLMVIWNLLKR